MRILVVENDGDQIRWLRRNLSKAGHEVICTMDGDCALGSWKIQRPFDFVVTCSLLRGKKIKSGVELVAAIRAADPLQEFVMQVGDKDPVPFAVPVLCKPYSFRRLLKLLEPTAQASLPLRY